VMRELFILILLGAALYYLYRENHLIEVTHFKLKIPHTLNRLSGVKILQLTDLHLPNGGASIEDIIKTAKEEKPHLIVLTGDLVHASVKDFPAVELAHLGNELSAIAPVYAITGNHDLGTSQMDKWKDVLDASGVRILINETEWIPLGEEGFLLMGLSETEELHPGDKNFLKHIKLPKGKENLPKVLLAHHPEFFEDYVKESEKTPDLV